jgi:hypothetical protein
MRLLNLNYILDENTNYLQLDEEEDEESLVQRNTTIKPS